MIVDPEIDIEKDKLQELPSPRFRVATTDGRGVTLLDRIFSEQ